MAFGIGIAIGIIPGTGGIAAAAVATILRLNLPIMVAGALLTNPVTAPFVYTGSYLMGDWLAGEWLPTGTLPRLLAGTVVGNLVLAVSLGIAGYLLVFGVMKISK